jgi:hypothetical protein
MLCFSRASVHLVPSTSLSRCRSCRHNCSDALHRRCVGSSGAEGLFAKTLLSASTRASDEPLSYRQFIRCLSFVWVRLCLDSNEVPNRPTVSSLRPSDHPVLLILLNSSGASRNWTLDHPTVTSSFCLLRSVPSTPTLAPMVPSVHPMVSIFFIFFHISLSSHLVCGIFACMRPRNAYKDMLNNMVTLIDHVVMNHQNHTQTNDI